jgi:hypothetical protein
LPCAKKQTIILDDIIKHKCGGVGFKLTFQEDETANHIKDMIRWILQDEGYGIVYNKGFYDKYDKDGYEK